MVTIYLANLGAYNRGHLIGAHIQLPLPKEQLQEKIDEILNGKEAITTRSFKDQPDEEVAIHDYESEFDLKITEYTNIWKLNESLEELEQLSDNEQTLVKAVLQSGIDDQLLSIIDEIHNYVLYSDVHSDRDLGYCYLEDERLPEHLTHYFDYERYGKDNQINELGEYTQYGYVKKIL